MWQTWNIYAIDGAEPVGCGQSPGQALDIALTMLDQTGRFDYLVLRPEDGGPGKIVLRRDQVRGLPDIIRIYGSIG